MIDREFEDLELEERMSFRLPIGPLTIDPLEVVELEGKINRAMEDLKARREAAESTEQRLASLMARYNALRRVAITLVSFQAVALVALVAYVYWRSI